MLKATKATIKRLDIIVKAADASEKNYYNDNEMNAYRLLQWINQAEEFDGQIKLLEQYDPEGLKDLNESIINNPYSIFYTFDGLTVKGLCGNESYWVTGLAIKYPELVNYMHCLDINSATIKDVNKLVKTIIEF